MARGTYTGLLQPWVNEIVRRYRLGHPPSQIAGALHQKIMALYPERKPWKVSEADAALIVYVLKRVGEWQEPAPPGVVAHQREEKVLQLRADGLTFEEIGKRVGVGKARVGQILHHAQRRLEAKAERDARRARTDRLIEAMFAPKVPPRILGRPIDMGGPRDVWIERGPWDDT